MKVGLADYSGLDPAVAAAIRQLEEQIRQGFAREHYADGSHKVVTADGVNLSAMAIPLAGVVTMPQLTANRDNYVIPNLTTVLVVKIRTDAARNITGIVAPTDLAVYRRLQLRNIGSFDAVLVHASANSFATNRFACPGAANVTVNAGDSVWIQYDPVLYRWVVEGL